MFFQMEFKVGKPGSLPDLPEVDGELIEKVLENTLIDFENGWHAGSIFNKAGEIIGSWKIAEERIK